MTNQISYGIIKSEKDMEVKKLTYGWYWVAVIVIAIILELLTEQLVSVWFVCRNAVVGKALITNAYLLLAKVVAKSLHRAKIVVLGTKFQMNDRAFLLICCHSFSAIYP